jgi:hypothetical protein
MSAAMSGVALVRFEDYLIMPEGATVRRASGTEEQVPVVVTRIDHKISVATAFAVIERWKKAGRPGS